MVQETKEREVLRALESGLRSIGFMEQGVADLKDLSQSLAPMWQKVDSIDKALEPYRDLKRQLDGIWSAVHDLEQRLEPMHALERELATTKDQIREALRRGVR